MSLLQNLQQKGCKILAQQLIKQILLKFTKGRGLTGAHLTFSERSALVEWGKDQPKFQGVVYRLLRVNLNDFFEKHLYHLTQEEIVGKDQPIEIKALESWTQDKHRVYGYGKPEGNEEPVLLILNTVNVSFIDISKYSVYPEEQEVINLDDLKLEVYKADYDRSLGWKLKVRPIHD